MKRFENEGRLRERVRAGYQKERRRGVKGVKERVMKKRKRVDGTKQSEGREGEVRRETKGILIDKRCD